MPQKSRGGETPRLVRHDAAGGRREGGGQSRDPIPPHVLDERHGLARNLQPPRVESLAHEPVPDSIEKEPGIDVGGSGVGGGDRGRVWRVERSNEEPRLSGIACKGEVEEVTAVRQEARPAKEVPALRSQMRQRGRLPARFGHTFDLASRVRREDDGAGGTPGAAARGRRIAKSLRRPSGRLDLLQLPGGEEGEEPSVGRPERVVRAVGPFERPRLE